MRRRRIPKRLRFAVFRRDEFTCQYCGQKPPEVILVTDHVVPHSKGGTDDEPNLITSCEACNSGKSDSMLGDEAPKPDRAMALLEAQQEIAEMQRAHEAEVRRREMLASLIADLQERWCEVAGSDWHPVDDQFVWLLERYGYDVTARASDAVARKLRHKLIKRNGWVPYLRATARNMASGG